MTADQLLVFDLVVNALCERELLTINLSALSDIDIGREKFRLEVQRLTKVFGQGVHSPEQSSTAQRVARTLQANLSSTYIAQLIERQTRASVQAQSARKILHTPITQMGTIHSSIKEDVDGHILWAHDLLSTKSVFLNSNAFVAYRKELLGFAHDPYKDRILRSISRVSKVVDGSGKVLDRQGIVALAEELCWTPIALLAWSHDKFLSIADRMKGLVTTTATSSFSSNTV
jgi:hypothetical protein